MFETTKNQPLPSSSLPCSDAYESFYKVAGLYLRILNQFQERWCKFLKIKLPHFSTSVLWLFFDPTLELGLRFYCVIAVYTFYCCCPPIIPNYVQFAMPRGSLRIKINCDWLRRELSTVGSLIAHDRHEESWLFKTLPGQTWNIKTGSDIAGQQLEMSKCECQRWPSNQPKSNIYF